MIHEQQNNVPQLGACAGDKVVMPSFDRRVLIRSVEDIAGITSTKSQRSAIHDAVHLFRAAHDFIPETGGGYPKHYLRQLERYGVIADLPASQRSLIESLSSPEGYSAVRQAGRMRVSAAPLSGQQLREICREIRAALSWRARYNP